MTNSTVLIAAAEESTQTFAEVHDPMIWAEMHNIKDFASKKEKM